MPLLPNPDNGEDLVPALPRALHLPPDLPTLGQLLRALRQRNGWTLKEMSARAGIPFSTLSKVEHDRLTLSYDKLQSISQRLDIGMSELFATPAVPPPAAVTARRSIGRIEDAVHIDTPNYDYYYLCPELRLKQMVPLLVRLHCRSLEEFGPLVRHQGEEHTFVLEGEVVFHTEYYDPVLLKSGESVYIDSSMGHAYVLAPGCDTALLLSACSSTEHSLMPSLKAMRDGGHAGKAEAAEAPGSAEPRPDRSARKSSARPGSRRSRPRGMR